MDEPEVREQVDDLLLTEVPAAGHAERRQPLAPKRLLVALGVGTGREQHRDLTGGGLARVDELAHPGGDRPGLSLAPVLAGSLEARLVRHQELDRVAEHGIGELRGSGERLILVAEDVTEEAVHRGEHLRARPVVLRQREHALRLLPALAEDLDVRVPEAVDRLELVAHREDLGEIRMCDQIDELALQSIRVLELVDHDDPEPELRLLPHGLVIPQEITGCQLEILEVDRRLPALGGRVLRRETLEQLLQEVAVGRGELLEGGALGGLPCQFERRGARSLGGECGQIDQALGCRRRADDTERLGRIAPLRHGGGRVVGELRPPRLAAALLRPRGSSARRARAPARDPPSASSRTRR